MKPLQLNLKDTLELAALVLGIVLACALVDFFPFPFPFRFF